MTIDREERDIRWHMQRRVDDSITWMSFGLLTIIISGALLFILSGGWIPWSLLTLGLIMLVKGWVEQKIARRAQRRYDVTGQT